VNFVDIGASTGTFAAAVQNHCGIRRALLVEPQPQRCRELETRFDDDRFLIRCCAVADHNGSSEMEILNFDYSSSLLRVKPEVGGAGRILDFGVREKIAVQLRTLDDLLIDAGWDQPIDLLKIDVQGAELLAFKGAVRSLARIRLIWTEVSFRQQYEGSAEFADIYQFLSQQGFHLYSLHEGFRGEGGELLQADALFIANSTVDSMR
jgi:FkbM family methyltransferase